VLNLRDVRQAALSWVHHLTSAEITAIPQPRVLKRRRQHSDPRLFELVYLDSLRRWASFQEGWLRCLEEEQEFDILLTDYDELRDDEPAYFDRILGHYAMPPRIFDRAVLTSDKKERAGHFRRGEKREWETVLSAQTLEEMDRIVRHFPRVFRTACGEGSSHGGEF
jgi:hypothetical protein